MTRIAWVSGWLFLVVAANGFAQNSSTPTSTVVSTPEDYAIYAVGLDYYFAKRNPERLLLRDRTSSRPGGDPLNALPTPGVPKEVMADFDTRNRTAATVEPEKIKTQMQVRRLGGAEERKLNESGGCTDTEPVAFVSRPGLNAEHDLAVLSVGTGCYDQEYSTVLLLKKIDGEWKVLTRLYENSITIDRFFERPTPTLVEIVGVQQIDDGSHYRMNVSFLVPDAPGHAFDTVTVYGMRIVGTERLNDKSYPTLHGNWNPNDTVEFSVELPKEFSDPAKGWNLTFCVGSSASCYPSSNLLKLATRADQ